MKSDCAHSWVKEWQGGPEICLWCGIPKVRTSTPVPRLKLPQPTAEKRWQDLKSHRLVRK